MSWRVPTLWYENKMIFLRFYEVVVLCLKYNYTWWKRYIVNQCRCEQSLNLLSHSICLFWFFFALPLILFFGIWPCILFYEWILRIVKYEKSNRKLWYCNFCSLLLVECAYKGNGKCTSFQASLWKMNFILIPLKLQDICFCFSSFWLCCMPTTGLEISTALNFQVMRLWRC